MKSQIETDQDGDRAEIAGQMRGLIQLLAKNAPLMTSQRRALSYVMILDRWMRMMRNWWINCVRAALPCAEEVPLWERLVLEMVEISGAIVFTLWRVFMVSSKFSMAAANVNFRCRISAMSLPKACTLGFCTASVLATFTSS